MYDSANLVVFVNVDDFFDAARNAASMLKATEALSLHISYESDLLALEPLTGLCREWLDFTRGVPNLNVELRTRCGTFLKNAPPLDRFIAAWSLSPAEVVKKYEFGAPKLNARLRAAASAAASGFPIRLCFDPVLPVENGFEHYTQLFESVFDALPKASIKDVGIGPFRAEKAHLQKMRQGHLENDLVWDDASLRSESLAVALSKSLECFIEKEKIALWQSQS